MLITLHDLVGLYKNRAFVRHSTVRSQLEAPGEQGSSHSAHLNMLDVLTRDSNQAH